MKKIYLIILSSIVFLMSGCLETTEEITINEDGTGSYVNVSDLSFAITLAKNMGGGRLDKLPAQKLDSIVSLSSIADKIEGLTEQEKLLMNKGTMNIKMNVDDENFITSMNFSFNSLDEISQFNKLAGKTMMETLKTQLPEEMPTGLGGEMPAISSMEDYYKIEFSDDKLEKKLNKEKYANVTDDQMLQGMKKATEFGIPVSHTYIINLPRPAEKAEGKKIKLSEDKKRITVTTGLDDFFDNPESLEFKVKF